MATTTIHQHTAPPTAPPTSMLDTEVVAFLAGRSVPCPRPVSASEPKSSASIRPEVSAGSLPGRRFRKSFAARSGPMVCELEGPGPTL